MTRLIAGLKPYPAMKTSGGPWLGDIPRHWEVAQLGRIGRIFKGKGGPKEDEVPTGVPCVRYGDLYTKHRYFVRKSRSFIAEAKAIDYTPIEYGDVLFAGSGETLEEIGKSAVNLIEGSACCGGDVIVLRPEIEVNPSFLGYTADNPYSVYQKSCMGRGITVMHIYSDELKYLTFPLPPLPEQAAIVRYLDNVDWRINRYIRAKQSLIALLEEQKQATIHRAVTRGLDPDVRLKPSGVEWLGDVPKHWEVRRLRTVADVRVSNVDKHANEHESRVRLCNYVDVYRNDRITQAMPFMRATASQHEIARFRLRNDDVLITKDSESWDDIGVPALVAGAADDLLSGYHLALLRPFKLALGAYLAQSLRCDAIAYQFHIRANGVTRYGLNRASIQSVRVPFPPLSEQSSIVCYLDHETTTIDTTIERARRQISLLSEYHTRLIADVVTGKLDAMEAASSLPEVHSTNLEDIIKIDEVAADAPAPELEEIAT